MNPSYNAALTFGPLADDLIGAGEIYGEAGAAATSFFGPVGIGTTSPDSMVDIEGSTAPELRFTTTSTGVTWELGDAGNGTFKISRPGAGPAVEVRFSDEGLFGLNQVASPPTTNVIQGSIYNDDSGALCWYDGATWLVVVGAGTCN